MDSIKHRSNINAASTSLQTSNIIPIAKYQKETANLVSYTLNQRQLCDLELLLNGGFAPLDGFMNELDYNHVLDQMRLADGHLWPMPITLDVDAETAANFSPQQEIALRDPEGLLLAILKISDIWQVDKAREAQSVFGTVDEKHPGVHYLNYQARDYYIGGKLFAVSLPIHYDFTHLRHTPSQLKAIFNACGWERIVAFQTRNPMHRAHQELTLRAAQQVAGNILLHPVVGMTKPGDIDYFQRVRCYEHVLKTYPQGLVMLSLLPLAMRMGGPREALWHALIRKNYGATHFIVGRDHAGPGKNTQGELFYHPYAAQELALAHQAEIGLQILPFQEMVYSLKQKTYFPINEFPADETPASISGTELREGIANHQPIPDWFSYPEVIAELRNAYPPKHEQGFTVFFTGLPSSGKSTLANALAIKLRELTVRPITMLDGDIIRTHLSKGLTFSPEDREMNVTRVGFVAQEITKHKGIAICALVSPFNKARQMVRSMISAHGGFIEVYVATPLATCEERDRKGLYKKARSGLIKQFTGVSDPYEAPATAEITIDTSNLDPAGAIETIIEQIAALGYLNHV